MATKKLTKKELKQPDQFVGFWQIASARLGRFAAKNAKVLVVSISALATVAVGMVVLSYVAEGRAARASAALEHVQQIAGAELAPAGSPLKTDNIPRYPTEKERLEGGPGGPGRALQVGARAAGRRGGAGARRAAPGSGPRR